MTFCIKCKQCFKGQFPGINSSDILIKMATHINILRVWIQYPFPYTPKLVYGSSIQKEKNNFCLEVSDFFPARWIHSELLLRNALDSRKSQTNLTVEQIVHYKRKTFSIAWQFETWKFYNNFSLQDILKFCTWSKWPHIAISLYRTDLRCALNRLHDWTPDKMPQAYRRLNRLSLSLLRMQFILLAVDASSTSFIFNRVFAKHDLRTWHKSFCEDMNDPRNYIHNLSRREINVHFLAPSQHQQLYYELTRWSAPRFFWNVIIYCFS